MTQRQDQKKLIINTRSSTVCCADGEKWYTVAVTAGYKPTSKHTTHKIQTTLTILICVLFADFGAQQTSHFSPIYVQALA